MLTGNIEVILGSPKMYEAMELSTLRKRPWPMQVRALIDEHSQLMDNTDSATVTEYSEYLLTVLKVQTILSSLKHDNTGEEAKSAENYINNYLKKVESPDIDKITDSTAALSALEKELTSLKDVSAINDIVRDSRVKKALAAVSEESELASILENIYEDLMKKVHSAERSLTSRCNSLEGMLMSPQAWSCNELTQKYRRGRARGTKPQRVATSWEARNKWSARQGDPGRPEPRRKR